MKSRNRLNGPIGVFFYLLLRNDWSWKWISEEDKEIVEKANYSHNVERLDYKNPEIYGEGRIFGGENWDSESDRKSNLRGRVLIDLLQKIKPDQVLEIGPGAGYFTKTVCEHPSVQYYHGMDIGQSFLDYLRPRLKRVQEQKSFNFDLTCGLLNSLPKDKTYDMIILLSAVHHIPNRLKLFRELTAFLKPGGYIYCFDPSHYLIRITLLILAMFKGGILNRDYYMNRLNLSTHHFCTYGEYRGIVGRIPGLKLVEEFYVVPRKLQRIPLLSRFFSRVFSTEMGILIKKIDL